jgi:hypothetical protein
MFFMPVEPASSEEETDFSFHINLPMLREEIPQGIFAQVRLLLIYSKLIISNKEILLIAYITVNRCLTRYLKF